MKRVLVIDAGLKPGWTKKTADLMIENLSKVNNYEFERINLRDEQIALCQGCALCLDRGEEKCKNFGDSADEILQKMMWADGIITVTPNYSLQVPWNLKNLYDRLAFVFHRPRLFGKISMAIVVQGVYGGNKIVKYIEGLMGFWGCDSVKGVVVSGGIYPNSNLSKTIQDKNTKAISIATQRFSDAIENFKLRRPSFFKLAIFRMTRSSMKHSPEVLPADKKYFEERGWTESEYFYNIRLGFLRTIFGKQIDRMIKNMIIKEEKSKSN